jgi:hypothetical protein
LLPIILEKRAASSLCDTAVSTQCSAFQPKVDLKCGINRHTADHLGEECGVQFVQHCRQHAVQQQVDVPRRLRPLCAHQHPVRCLHNDVQRSEPSDAFSDSFALACRADCAGRTLTSVLTRRLHRFRQTAFNV